MIRGILEKGTSRVMGNGTAALPPPPASGTTSGGAGDVKATASTSSTASSSTESSGNGTGISEQRRATSRPKTNSEDSTTGNFFRDSTVPIAKSISKSAGKIFRSADRNHATASDPHANPQHPQQHHPLHSSTTSSTISSSNNNNKPLSSSSLSSNFVHGMSGGTEPRPGKKCSLCGKNFNPLRRRYFCRVCTVEVCSNCSLKRKVDSSLEGAISIRICMACKMNTSAPQSDYYDRAFSVASALHPGGDDGVFGGDIFGDGGSNHGDRSSAVSFMSAVSHSKPEKRRPFSSASSVTSSSSAAATTPANYKGKQLNTQQQTAAGSVSGGLRRTSSSASAQSGVARSRRDSFGSVAAPAECQMCMNEACSPMVDLVEVPYPAMETKGPSGNERFVRARSLDNEKERLDSVRKIRRVLTDSPHVAQRFSQLCSMASIATQSRIAVIALLDKDDYFVVSESGLPANATPLSRTLTLASHTCRNGAPLVCSDLGSDIRFAGNPWRRDTLNVLFYAGIPLTLANGHTIGAIEVFDKHMRYACMDVVTQLQAVVRGLLKKFEEILASVPAETAEPEAAAEEDPIALAIAALERSTSYGDVKPSSGQARSPARRAAAPPPPATAPLVAAPASTAAPVAPEPVPAVVPDPAPTPQAVPAPAGPTENEMEMRLMELLSQTTSTQEQLRNQQGHMVHAISSHSKQISDLAKQLERMESTLNSKLDGIPAAPPSKPAAALSSTGDDSPETPVP